MARLIEIPSSVAVSFDERKALVRLGYGSRWTTAAPRILSLIRDEIRRAAALVEIRIVAAELDRSEIPDHPVFKQTEKAALCLCTIGSRLEEAQAGLMAEGEVLRAFVLDCLGSEAVGTVFRRADAYLAQWGRQAGLWPSKAFSPGFRGWDISAQRFVFSILPAAEIGISLTESFMMVPRKSTSFRINFYKDKALTSRRFKENPGGRDLSAGS